MPFALAFVATRITLDGASRLLTARAAGDAVLWFAYPKKTSRRSVCEFDRDSGWDALGAAGFAPVRMVAIDEDWSALRSRKNTYLRRLTGDPGQGISVSGQAMATAARGGQSAMKAARTA